MYAQQLKEWVVHRPALSYYGLCSPLHARPLFTFTFRSLCQLGDGASGAGHEDIKGVKIARVLPPQVPG